MGVGSSTAGECAAMCFNCGQRSPRVAGNEELHHFRSSIRSSIKVGECPMKTIMSGKYQLDVSRDGVLGEGSFCICRKGKVVETGEAVAIKVYKAPGKFSKDASLMKHRRSVAVLQALQKPFKEPADPKLWNSQLDNVKPDKLFMRLIDYSKNEFGEPGYDPTDKELYVVTELAQSSLKDYVDQRREESAPPSKETVRSLAKAIILVMAGLHAKGFVHLDMKPENLMIFDGRLKLIDVDGCVEIGTSISIDDKSISFSPCYCSPEWASFLINHHESSDIRADPDLDTWSVGCTICELITLDAMMRPTWKKFSRSNARTGRVRFMQWLSNLEEPPLPRVVQKFDDELVMLLTDCLMVPSPSGRRTCAESLDVPYLAADKLMRTKSSPIKAQAFEEELPKLLGKGQSWERTELPQAFEEELEKDRPKLFGIS